MLNFPASSFASFQLSFRRSVHANDAIPSLEISGCANRGRRQPPARCVFTTCAFWSRLTRASKFTTGLNRGSSGFYDVLLLRQSSLSTAYTFMAVILPRTPFPSCLLVKIRWLPVPVRVLISLTIGIRLRDYYSSSPNEYDIDELFPNKHQLPYEIIFRAS